MNNKRGPQYSYNGYLNKLRTTRKQVLLVEGRDDKRFFKCYIDAAINYGIVSTNPDIDTADIFKAPEGMDLGNRKKVEAACQGLEGEQDGSKLVGFVDREFRGFDISQNIEDQIKNHHQEGRVIWSRGHSIENYYFDFETLHGPMKMFTGADEFDNALRRFADVFDSALKVACAVSLVARQLDCVSILRNSVKWSQLYSNSNIVNINLSAWRKALTKKLKCTDSMCDSIIESYNHWHERATSLDRETVRWISHGHIGLGILWAAYARCVFEVTKENKKEADSVFKVDEKVRFNSCVEASIQRALDESACSPMIVLEMLKIKTRNNEERDDGNALSLPIAAAESALTG